MLAPLALALMAHVIAVIISLVCCVSEAVVCTALVMVLDAAVAGPLVVRFVMWMSVPVYIVACSVPALHRTMLAPACALTTMPVNRASSIVALTA